MWKTSLLPEALERTFRPRSPLSVSGWAAKEVYLSPLASPTAPGFYDPDLTPYARDIQDGFTDPSFDEDHTAKSSQLGITEGVLNIIRYAAAEAPVNTIYAIDSVEEVRKINKVRLTPSLRANKATARSLTDNPDDLTSQTLYLANMVAYLIGSHAAAAFENKPAGLIILDELAKHKQTPGLPSTVDLARQRQKTYRGPGRKKLYTLSKPDTEDDIVWQEYLTGTREKFFVPCPHCGHEQELVWERVRFGEFKDLAGYHDLERVRTETYYECEKNGCRIEETHKREMLLRAAARPDKGWRRTNFEQGKYAPRPRKRSRQISDLYSPFATWGEMAGEFIEAGSNPGKLKNFRNGRLGLPSVNQAGEVKTSDILRLRGAYRRGECPVTPVFLPLASDVQGDVKKWATGGFAANGDLYVVDYGVTLAFDELATDVAFRAVICLDTGEERVAQMLLIDEGFHTTDVRDFAQRCSPLLPIFTSKGRGGIQVRQTVSESPMIHRGEEMVAYHYDDDAIKRELYLSRIKDVVRCLAAIERAPDSPAATEARRKLATLPRVWFPVDMDPEFYEELTAEKYVRDETNKGFTKWVWVKDSTKANDWGDAVKLLQVLWHAVGPIFAASALVNALAPTADP